MVGIKDNTYDGAFAFEATCHAPKPVDVYSEIYRVLKPGAYFLDSAWAMTDSYDPKNPEHEHIKYEIEVRIGLKRSIGEGCRVRRDCTLNSLNKKRS